MKRKNYFGKSAKLIESWQSRISLVEKASKKRMSYDMKMTLSQCLENTRSAIRMMEATDAGATDGYKMFALDLVSAIVPNLVAANIVAVQPIDNEIGVINYIKYLYSDDKGKVKAGDEFASGILYTGSDANYAGQDVVGEGCTVTPGAAGTITSNLAWKPIIKGSIKIPVQVKTSTVDNAIVNIVDVNENSDIKVQYGTLEGEGKLVAINPATGEEIADVLDATSKIDYKSGKLDVKLAAGAELVSAEPILSYRYDNRSIGGGQIGSNNLKVPGVDIKIESMPVVCQSRKLKALYAYDSAFKLQKEYGTDINALLNSQIASEIIHEIDAEIMNDLFNGAGLVNDTWTTVVPDGISAREHYESFLIKLVDGSNKIFQATKRSMANFVVVGVKVATVLESLPSFQPAGAADVVGPHISGTISGLTVIKNPYFDPKTYVLGYKGTTIFDAGYFYCPYMPVTTTDVVMLDDFVGRRGWATSYAKKMVQPLLYCKGNVVTE